MAGGHMAGWRFLNWEWEGEIDFPSPADGGPAVLLTRDGRTIAGTLSVTVQGDALPLIAFRPDDGSAFDFFDAIAWRRG